MYGHTTQRNRVIPGLHVGDYQDALAELRGPRSHTLLVLCAEEIQPEGVVLPMTLCLPLRDDDEPMSADLLELTRWTSRRVAEQVDTSGSVLVTCAMGLNRSGLVAALALRELGRSADEAVQLVRDARGPLALRNEQFLALIAERREDNHLRPVKQGMTTRLGLSVPTVHLNGTSGGVLLRMFKDARHSLRLATTALQCAAPNARDYYLQPGGVAEAQRQHEARIAKLREVEEEVVALMESVQEQIDARGAR